MKKSDLKPYNAVIQVCPACGKIDVYKNDGHSCSDELDHKERQMNDTGWD